MGDELSEPKTRTTCFRFFFVNVWWAGAHTRAGVAVASLSRVYQMTCGECDAGIDDQPCYFHRKQKNAHQTVGMFARFNPTFQDIRHSTFTYVVRTSWAIIPFAKSNLFGQSWWANQSRIEIARGRTVWHRHSKQTSTRTITNLLYKRLGVTQQTCRTTSPLCLYTWSTQRSLGCYNLPAVSLFKMFGFYLFLFRGPQQQQTGKLMRISREGDLRPIERNKWPSIYFFFCRKTSQSPSRNDGNVLWLVLDADTIG